MVKGNASQVHILNGDALRTQFPDQIDGEKIVLRECLVDGGVSGNDLNELFETRSQFLANNYGGSVEDYYIKFVPEVEKILGIDQNSEVCLWFEDDLFCQVNLWFTLNLLCENKNVFNISLVRPSSGLALGFGGMSKDELFKGFQNRSKITNLELLGSLWRNYQENNLTDLHKAGVRLSDEYPFVLNAIEAHIKRQADENGEDHLRHTLREISKELGTNEFGAIFREFHKREPIYGFGDLQVRRILKELGL